MKEAAHITGFSSKIYWQIPQYLHCSNVQWTIAASITRKFYFQNQKTLTRSISYTLKGRNTSSEHRGLPNHTSNRTVMEGPPARPRVDFYLLPWLKTVPVTALTDEHPSTAPTHVRRTQMISTG